MWKAQKTRMAVEAAFACSGTLGFGSRGYNLQRNSDLFILLEVEKRTLRIRNSFNLFWRGSQRCLTARPSVLRVPYGKGISVLIKCQCHCAETNQLHVVKLWNSLRSSFDLRFNRICSYKTYCFSSFQKSLGWVSVKEMKLLWKIRLENSSWAEQDVCLSRVTHSQMVEDLLDWTCLKRNDLLFLFNIFVDIFPSWGYPQQYSLTLFSLSSRS